jgi:hypothetical protein
MVHIPGLLNRASDILSREGVTELFYSTAAQDFPFVRTFQDISSRLPAEIRSMSNLL